MKKIIFVLCCILPLRCFGYIHSPYSVVYCGNTQVLKNGEPYVLPDVPIWIWPDGCASANSKPETETDRCYYMCHRYNNSDIDCWNGAYVSERGKIKIRGSVLTDFDIRTTLTNDENAQEEEVNLKLAESRHCDIDTKVSAEPIYPYKVMSISGAPLPND